MKIAIPRPVEARHARASVIPAQAGIQAPAVRPFSFANVANEPSSIPAKLVLAEAGSGNLECKSLYGLFQLHIAVLR